MKGPSISTSKFFRLAARWLQGKSPEVELDEIRQLTFQVVGVSGG